MNKCKYMKCNKEVADGQKYCKFHQQKRKIKKTVIDASSGLGAILVFAIFNKKLPKKF